MTLGMWLKERHQRWQQQRRRHFERAQNTQLT